MNKFFILMVLILVSCSKKNKIDDIAKTDQVFDRSSVTNSLEQAEVIYPDGVVATACGLTIEEFEEIVKKINPLEVKKIREVENKYYKEKDIFISYKWKGLEVIILNLQGAQKKILDSVVITSEEMKLKSLFHIGERFKEVKTRLSIDPTIKKDGHKTIYTFRDNSDEFENDLVLWIEKEIITRIECWQSID